MAQLSIPGPDPVPRTWKATMAQRRVAEADREEEAEERQERKVKDKDKQDTRREEPEAVHFAWRDHPTLVFTKKTYVDFRGALSRGRDHIGFRPARGQVIQPDDPSAESASAGTSNTSSSSRSNASFRTTTRGVTCSRTTTSSTSCRSRVASSSCLSASTRTPARRISTSSTGRWPRISWRRAATSA